MDLTREERAWESLWSVDYLRKERIKIKGKLGYWKVETPEGIKKITLLVHEHSPTCRYRPNFQTKLLLHDVDEFVVWVEGEQHGYIFSARFVKEGAERYPQKINRHGQWQPNLRADTDELELGGREDIFSLRIEWRTPKKG